MGRDTGIPWGKNPGCPKRRKGRQRGNEVREVEGTHSSLGKNPPITKESPDMFSALRRTVNFLDWKGRHLLYKAQIRSY